jgi:hypothetical protein
MTNIAPEDLMRRYRGQIRWDVKLSDFTPRKLTDVPEEHIQSIVWLAMYESENMDYTVGWIDARASKDEGEGYYLLANKQRDMCDPDDELLYEVKYFAYNSEFSATLRPEDEQDH